jgi:MFS family permease
MNLGLEGQAPSEMVRKAASPWKQLTGYQWFVLLVAWLGWVFDSMDALIYAQVMTPALKELLGARGSPQNIGWYGGIIFSIFIVGWALGGVLFGVLADYLGRSRTLAMTILVYAVFTALAGFSHTWWELGIYRFLTALGVGGEWAAGATLVAEVWPESLRVKGAGLLQSAWGFGFFLAAGINLLLSSYSWRVMFFVGIIPALVAVLMRLKLREPERWTSQHREAKSPGSERLTILALFSPETRRDTLVGTSLALVAVFGLWGATNWTPSLMTELLRPQHLDAIATARRVSFAVMSLNAGAILGYLAAPLIAERWGRRAMFLLLMLGSALALPLTFLIPSSFSTAIWLLPFLGFFSNGIFSGFPVYFPEIFPTRIRATGAGFCFNAGRIFAAAGPFLTGYLVLHLGTFARAASSIALIYVLGLLILPFARETRGEVIQ